MARLIKITTAWANQSIDEFIVISLGGIYVNGFVNLFFYNIVTKKQIDDGRCGRNIASAFMEYLLIQLQIT